ncbi:WxL domain-containing protein [Enterococcus faecalis]|uniref:WxL domain-containing protein n=1 Tax=Enterococcus faecalis TaxID=1351 RepID=UPI001BE01183|nr:WxL domain-containing protein [Enterococcus faecalis]
MKRNKWQRLAAIGLCSSLLVNAFSGVTAVAETVTIESSPTAESSAKEETQASSVKEETTKASTENSQVTTDTSQEEETKEAEKQAETEVKEEQKEEPQAEVEQAETATSEVVQSNPLPTPVGGISTRVAGNLSTAYQQFINIRNSFSTTSVKTQIITPNVLLGINLTDSAGRAVNTSDFGINATISGVSAYYYPDQKIYRYYTVTPVSITSTKDANGFLLNIPAKDAQAQASASYTRMIYNYFLKDVNLSVPEYVSSVNVREELAPLIIERAQYPYRYPSNIKLSIRKINSQNYSVATNPLPGDAYTTSEGAYFNDASYIYRATVDNHYDVSTLNSFSVVIPQKDLKLSIDYKQVTEKFVDTNGVAITPPTGFTQNKKTPMTSNAFTFKQAGTLPDTYTTGGKTYKFKGWYKGKTKPSTLTTTKAPSYKVTYDGNDDLTVMYEEVEAIDFPAVNYQFGFVSEAGTLINPADISITYDYLLGQWKNTDKTMTWDWSTLQTNQRATNVESVKNVLMPATSIPQPKEQGDYRNVTANFSITLPRFYKTASLYDKTGKISTKYPLPTIMLKNSVYGSQNETEANVIRLLNLTQRSDNSLVPGETYTTTTPDVKYPELTSRISPYPTANYPKNYAYRTMSAPAYYHLTNRRVTENFVDTSGAKITPPTGFTQGKQTVIDSDPYTFKQAGTLPDTYTTGGKTYKFKGWYKGKSTLKTLTTTKAPSYQVTYDDNDDLNVVYEEETVTTFYPSINLNFVNEKGGAFTPALTFSGKYNVQRASDKVITNLYDLTSKSNGNGQYTVSINNGSVPLSHELLKKYNNGSPISTTNSLSFKLDKLAIDQQLKYVDSIRVEAAQSSGLNTYRYDYTHDGSTVIDSSKAPIAINMSTAEINGLNFTTDGTNFSNTNNRFLGMRVGHSVSSTGSNYLFNTDLFSNNPTNGAKLVYKVTRKQVTENFVDANGAKITAPTGFTQGNQVPMNSNTFKYTAAQALPATYTTGGKVYTFQGWYKGKTKPSTLNKTTTPTFNATFDGNDDMTAMYKEEIPTASVTLTRPKEVIDTNTNVIWTTTITNTSKAPLQNLTLKKGPNWSAGLTIPTFMEVTPEGETTKSIPVNSTLWTDGVSLPNAVPIGKKVSVAFTTRATGNPNTVLKAEVVVFGGIKDRTVDNFVRIRPNDQEVVTPTTEGFISVPTFDFGQVGVAGSKQQHNLKQAADYYGNGTRNPYVRIKKTQPNWSLTAQLSQPKSATDSLPTATRLLLGAAPVSSFTNYNQPTELKNAVGTTSAISLTANNTATSIIANKQFTGSNVYQLDFTFNNVKLEVPANQGVKGQQYKAAVTWNLVTGP